MKSRTVLLSMLIGLIGSVSIQASITETLGDPSSSAAEAVLLLADTNAKKRRDNRQDDRGRSDNRDDRRDCRDDEGAVGKDKRDCKQDSRKGENNKDKDDKDNT